MSLGVRTPPYPIPSLSLSHPFPPHLHLADALACDVRVRAHHPPGRGDVDERGGGRPAHDRAGRVGGGRRGRLGGGGRRLGWPRAARPGLAPLLTPPQHQQGAVVQADVDAGRCRAGGLHSGPAGSGAPAPAATPLGQGDHITPALPEDGFQGEGRGGCGRGRVISIAGRRHRVFFLFLYSSCFFFFLVRAPEREPALSATRTPPRAPPLSPFILTFFGRPPGPRSHARRPASNGVSEIQAMDTHISARAPAAGRPAAPRRAGQASRPAPMQRCRRLLPFTPAPHPPPAPAAPPSPSPGSCCWGCCSAP